MRFVLADEKKANVKAIEAIPAVKGTLQMRDNFRLLLEMMFQFLQ